VTPQSDQAVAPLLQDLEPMFDDTETGRLKRIVIAPAPGLVVRHEAGCAVLAVRPDEGNGREAVMTPAFHRIVGIALSCLGYEMLKALIVAVWGE
jgi:hypothetical protein